MHVLQGEQKGRKVKIKPENLQRGTSGPTKAASPPAGGAVPAGAVDPYPRMAALDELQREYGAEWKAMSAAKKQQLLTERMAGRQAYGREITYI